MPTSTRIIILLILIITPQCERDNSEYDIKNSWSFLHFEEIQSGSIIQITAYDLWPEFEFFDSIVSLKTPCTVGEGPYFIFDKGKIDLTQVIVAAPGCLTEGAEYFENLYKNCIWEIESYQIDYKTLILNSESGYKLYYKLSEN